MAPVASASSGVSPTRKSHQKWPKARRVRVTALTVSPFREPAGQLCAHEGGEGEEDNDEEPDQHRDGQVAARPVHTGSFADPEHAEAGQHDADHGLDGVLGDFAQLARHQQADDSHQNRCGRRRQGGKAEAVLGRAQADHNEDDLGAFQEHALEGDGEPDAVVLLGPGRGRCSRRALVVRAELGHRCRINLVLVVRVLVPARPQDRLAQPRQPEHQQEGPDDHAQRVERDVADQRDADGEHEDPEHQQGRPGAFEGGTPAAAHAGRHHDGQRLDHLDQAGGEDGQDQYECGRSVHPDRKRYRRW